MLIDTHCHLDDSTFSGCLDEVLARAEIAGVDAFVVPGVDRASWRRMQELPAGRIFPAYGMHPLAVADYACSVADLEALAPLGVAIGEIGLDYLLDVPREMQQEAFRGQLQLARQLGLPVLIHCRRAFGDLLRILDEERVTGGVMHAFSGSPEIARECVRRGFYISIAGQVTWRNAVRPRDVVREIPLDRLLLETDSPDLTPEPRRGTPNEPVNLPLIAAEVARLKGVTAEEVARVTTENARRVLFDGAINHK